MIVGLMGLPGAGKDEFAKALVARGWVRVAFADPTREGLYALNPVVDTKNVIGHHVPIAYDKHGLGTAIADSVPIYGERRLQSIVDELGWDEAKRKFAEVRRLLRAYGTEAGRAIHGPECWNKIAKSKINKAVFSGRNVVVTDVRHKDEIMLCHNAGNSDYGPFTVSNVKFAHLTSPRQEVPSEHSSDQLDYSKYADVTVENTGTIEDLHEIAVGLFCDGVIA